MTIMTDSYDLSYLKWRCRRGTKELDILMTRYLTEYFQQASPDEQRAFVELLDWEDPELYGLIIGDIAEPDHPALVRVLNNIRIA